MTVRIIVGDALSQLVTLPDASVHCVVTSPPYWGLRAYQGDTWEGGDPACDHQRGKVGEAGNFRTGKAYTNKAAFGWPGNVCGKCGARMTGHMIGLEPTFDEHLDNLVAVFREVRRVLRNDGTLWLNYGDAYADGRTGLRANEPAGPKQRTSAGTMDIAHRPVPPGLKPKDLMMMPARVAIALQADGWWLRSEIIWHKPNPMPESCTDRPTSAHEKLFLLTKSARYFYDAEAVRVPSTWGRENNPDWQHQRAETNAQKGGGNRNAASGGFTKWKTENGANLRNVWTIATHAYSEAHFATFPPALVEPCILAGTSARGVCGECGAPWVREVTEATGGAKGAAWLDHSDDAERGGFKTASSKGYQRGATSGWSSSCECSAAVVPATCLDPFAGSGTVGMVADRLQRDAILLEISPEYAAMAQRRIEADAGGLFGPAVAAE